MGQAKPNKKRRIFKGNKTISEKKYQKSDPKVEFDPDHDIPEDLSVPKINENVGQKTPLDLTRSSSSSLELFESNSSSNTVRIEPPSKSLNLTITTPSHKKLPQLAPNYNNQRFRMYHPKILWFFFVLGIVRKLSIWFLIYLWSGIVRLTPILMLFTIFSPNLSMGFL